MSRRTTAADVARAASVSIATVSRFVNRSGPVSAEAGDAIRAAVERLRYRPNQFASALRTSRSRVVGVLTQSIATPFFTGIVAGIESALDAAGYETSVVSARWHSELEERRLERLVDRRVDGVILLKTRLGNPQLRRIAGGIPMVAIGRDVASAGLLGAALDNERGGYLATRHLLELGHRRIVHVCGVEGDVDTLARVAGYRRALAEFGLAGEPSLEQPGDFTEAGGHAAMARVLDAGLHFTAVFAANDESAAGARLALFRRGIRVPDDVSLVGFDDVPPSSYATPPLTTVRQPMADIGERAATALMQMMRGEPASFVMPPLGLVVRETTRRSS